MDYVTRRATRYKAMNAKGVYAGKLTCLNSWNGYWRIELNHISTISKEAAKEAARDYLVSEFEAYGISFVVDPTQRRDNAFAAKFMSDIL